MDLKGKRIGVYGFGITGRAVVDALLGRSCEIVVFDDRKDEKIEQRLAELAKSGNLTFHLGDWSTSEKLSRLNLLVASPGIRPDSPRIENIRNHGVEVISEIEFAWRAGRGTILAVTGSNGKSTTSALLGSIMSETRKNRPGNVYIVGNIGTPYIGIAFDSTDDDVIVVEVSSYQLETSPTFHPHIAIFTNITPDHLERHKTFEIYAAVKRSMVRNLNENDYVIYNREDENLQPDAFPNSSPKFLGFTSAAGSIPELGAWLENGEIILDIGKGSMDKYPKNMIKLRGLHNVENTMCAILAARIMGASQSNIIDSVSEFDGYPHRIEFVREAGGVKWFNDSKATNPESTITALRSFEEPIVLILGGRDKGTSLDSLVRQVKNKVERVILLGEAAERFENALREYGFGNIVRVASLKDAVAEARNCARPGRVVLFSPACASFDMFMSFEQRGDVFRSLVSEMKEAAL